MSFFKRLRLVFSYGPEIEELLKAAHQQRKDREFWENQQRLKLCYKHRQEANHSHYAERNCDYCRLLKTTNIENKL